ncbi:YihY/virulence factor BrkB family protein [Caldibacillus thermoamylovorans]|uniref:YihY/virulence factor BrkB family protein n=1 Tax=Bacillaceae TaxID=186817 RepID=UPI001863A0F8|nr:MULTISPECIES: YihY/virulence factor BrkB family protein [Bacillaceae]MCB5935228.1 YihY/virulence factor BrkB family protein [Bacillus sp. DFI.2.34]MCB7071276.1 YihY/virulence factor BrkB family protein [Caldibacillus sp. 210928-DFI.2.22]MCB7074739.1 YihY/virulence factor BrkB family protein [Caldibacillus sp. 210928-DFI.2.18]MCB7077611.1 YihY/virulence factor BrkB family protein [Caldibacillus thermoamylovorans]MDL0420813.1 YihY/virulence factor BrkB family protein [Caldibacillus thermoamyl
MINIKKSINWVLDLYRRIIRHDSLGYSAQLAYFFLLSLFPLLITMFSLLPYLPLKTEDIMYFISDFAPGETITFIDSTLDTLLEKHNGGILSFGIIATLWAASNGMNAIIRAMNLAYEIDDDRPFFIVRGLSVLLTIVMIAVFIIALLLPVFGKHIGIYISSKFGYTDQFIDTWNTIRFSLSSVILFIVFSAVYFLTPNRKMKCATVVPGAVFSTIGWILASMGFSFYVNNFGNYTFMYGSLGVIIVLMIWFYITGAVLIIGGEINGLNEENKRKNCK